MDEASRAGRGGARPGAGRNPKNADPIPEADLRAAQRHHPTTSRRLPTSTPAWPSASWLRSRSTERNETAAVGAANTIFNGGYEGTFSPVS